MNNFIKIKSLICEAKSTKDARYSLKFVTRGYSFNSDTNTYSPYLPLHALGTTSKRIGVRVLLVKI